MRVVATIGEALQLLGVLGLVLDLLGDVPKLLRRSGAWVKRQWQRVFPPPVRTIPLQAAVQTMSGGVARMVIRHRGQTLEEDVQAAWESINAQEAEIEALRQAMEHETADRAAAISDAQRSARTLVLALTRVHSRWRITLAVLVVIGFVLTTVAIWLP